MFYILLYNQRWNRGHKARGQGQRPRTGMLEAKAKEQGPRTQTQVFSGKKKVFINFFRRSPKKKKNGLEKHFLADLQNFSHSKK